MDREHPDPEHPAQLAELGPAGAVRGPAFGRRLEGDVDACGSSADRSMAWSRSGIEKLFFSSTMTGGSSPRIATRSQWFTSPRTL
ncbi:hypothetical protein LJK87_49115 [Paenibacillus sp. P25]|nr:hypothetical protein LJK87_49115 [Paenibacillus sp. P25]